MTGGETAKKDRWLYECPGLEELKIEGEDGTAWVLWGADNAYAVGTLRTGRISCIFRGRGGIR